MSKPERRRIRAFKPTNDDWYPSYRFDDVYKGEKAAGLVEVSLLDLSNSMVRVCVWGADDCGMERDYPPEEAGAAQAMFLGLLEQKTVDKAFLKKFGFVPA